MISPKKLIRMARKWQKLAASRRKRISKPRTTSGANDSEICSASSTAQKGHFVAYTADQRRFVIPLKYLTNDIIGELFRIAEDEFGLPNSGPITLPCDSVFMEYLVSLLRRRVTEDVEKALLMSLTTGRCLPVSNIHQEQCHQESLLCRF